MKCHEPAIFCAAILNVQPMGFYSTEVLVNDARRHGVVVRPVAVNASEWWSFVEPDGALRLGFHLVRGMGEAQRASARARARASRRVRATCSTSRGARKLAREAAREPGRRRRVRAVVCNARREAMWALRALDEREARGELGRAMEIDDEPSAAAARADARSNDRASTSPPPASDRTCSRSRTSAPHSTRGASSPRTRLPAMPNNLVCKIGGLVITRQRPGTAKGFVFLTIEDETGLVNVIVRPDVYERYRRTIRAFTVLIVEGMLQKEIRLHRPDRQALLAARYRRYDRKHPRAQLPLTFIRAHGREVSEYPTSTRPRIRPGCRASLR